MSAASRADVPYTEAQRREAAEWFVVIHDENDPNADTLQAWLRWQSRALRGRIRSRLRSAVVSSLQVVSQVTRAN